MTKKYDLGNIISVQTAEMLYWSFNIATVITDGSKIQLEKEKDAIE